MRPLTTDEELRKALLLLGLRSDRKWSEEQIHARWKAMQPVAHPDKQLWDDDAWAKDLSWAENLLRRNPARLPLQDGDGSDEDDDDESDENEWGDDSDPEDSSIWDTAPDVDNPSRTPPRRDVPYSAPPTRKETPRSDEEVAEIIARYRTALPEPGPMDFAAEVSIKLGILLAALIFLAAPFGVVYFVVLQGHTSGVIQGWWRNLLAVGCFFWFLYGLWAVWAAVLNIFD
jgi:hypothetical protein